jgi:hypothetical protein
VVDIDLPVWAWEEEEEDSALGLVGRAVKGLVAL